MRGHVSCGYQRGTDDLLVAAELALNAGDLSEEFGEWSVRERLLRVLGLVFEERLQTVFLVDLLCLLRG